MCICIYICIYIYIYITIHVYIAGVKNDPGKFHGQRSLVGYSPWDHKDLDTTEWLSMHIYYSCLGESHGQRNLVGSSMWLQKVRHELVTQSPLPYNTHITESLCATPKIKIKSTILQLRKKKNRKDWNSWFRSPGPGSLCNYSLVYGFLWALVPYPALSTFQLCFADPTLYCFIMSKVWLEKPAYLTQILFQVWSMDQQH